MEQLNEDQRLSRANQARQLLDNQLFKDTFHRLEADVLEAWANCSYNDKDGQLELSRLIKTVRKFRKMFEVYVNDGNYTEKQMIEQEHQESLMKRMSRRFRSV